MSLRSSVSIFTACKRSLRQGNVFTPVCNSVHGGMSAPLHAGIYPLGRTPPCRHPPGHTPPRQTSPLGHYGIRSTTTNGRYASYLNAYLFFVMSPSPPQQDFLDQHLDLCPRSNISHAYVHCLHPE